MSGPARPEPQGRGRRGRGHLGGRSLWTPRLCPRLRPHLLPPRSSSAADAPRLGVLPGAPGGGSLQAEGNGLAQSTEHRMGSLPGVGGSARLGRGLVPGAPSLGTVRGGGQRLGGPRHCWEEVRWGGRSFGGRPRSGSSGHTRGGPRQWTQRGRSPAGQAGDGCLVPLPHVPPQCLRTDRQPWPLGFLPSYTAGGTGNTAPPTRALCPLEDPQACSSTDLCHTPSASAVPTAPREKVGPPVSFQAVQLSGTSGEGG